jgi:N-formylglutamate deformylase
MLRRDRRPDTPMKQQPPFAVLHIPHASRVIPTKERVAICLSDDELSTELLRMTDSYTDELFDLDPGLASAVVFPISRLVVDPERFRDDAEEPMARRGMGVLYTHTSQRGTLRAPVSAAERERLMDRYYRPHHEHLTRAVESAIRACSSCLVLDGHSFASTALPYELDQSDGRPQICLGTDGFHSPPWLVDAARGSFEESGFAVALDRPFSGALVPAAHYRRDPRVRALMIEINRGLYMNEQSGERLEAFGDIRERLQLALRRVVAVAHLRHG